MRFRWQLVLESKCGECACPCESPRGREVPELRPNPVWVQRDECGFEIMWRGDQNNARRRGARMLSLRSLPSSVLLPTAASASNVSTDWSLGAIAYLTRALSSQATLPKTHQDIHPLNHSIGMANEFEELQISDADRVSLQPATILRIFFLVANLHAFCLAVSILVFFNFLYWESFFVILASHCGWFHSSRSSWRVSRSVQWCDFAGLPIFLTPHNTTKKYYF